MAKFVSRSIGGGGKLGDSRDATTRNLCFSADRPIPFDCPVT